MEEKKAKLIKADELRKRAEEKLRSKRTELEKISDSDTCKLVHELQVHQIELEMQNEELRKTQIQLEESRQRYVDLYDFAPVGYLTLDKRGIIKGANLTMARQLGVERGRLLNKPFPFFIHTDERDIFYLHLRKVFESKTRQSCEVTLKGKEGIEFNAQLDSILWEDLRRNNACRTSVIDVTKQKKGEEALRHERNKFTSILNAMEDGVYIVNQQYDIEYVNPALIKEFGPFEEHKCYQYFHDRDAVCPWCKNQEVFEGKTVRWEWSSPKNQKTYDLIDTPLKNIDGSISKLEIFRDITKRKQAEEKIKQDYFIQRTISSILQISLELISLKEQLERILDSLFSIPWLALQSKGRIYLVEDNSEMLVMRGQRGFSGLQLTPCTKIPFGKCLCGQAASAREVIFADCVDGRHEICYTGMLPHGHYCVPILSGERILGIICLYVMEGHKQEQEEKEFLLAVANTLAGIIERKKAEEALQKAKDELKLRVQERTAEFTLAVEELEREITERQKAERVVQEAREYAESIVNTIREPLIVLNEDLRVISVSPSFYKTFKVPPEETMEQFIYDLGNRQWNIPKLRVLLEEIIPKHTTFNNFEVEHDFETIGKKTMLLNARGLYREKHKPKMILLAIEDITERKRVEKALQASEERYQNLYDYAPDMYFTVMRDGTVTSVNQRLCKISHQDFSHLITTHPRPSHLQQPHLSFEKAFIFCLI